MAVENVNTRTVGDSPMDIRERMAERRTSITDKIEALETQVEERVIVTVDKVAQEIEAAVQRLSGTMQDTADDMAASLKDTFHMANDKVQNIVSGLGDSVDLKRLYNDRPYASLGVSIFAGLLIGRLLNSSQQ